jgi:hypothetical protein
LCFFLHSPFTSSVFGPDILLRTIFSNTVSHENRSLIVVLGLADWQLCGLCRVRSRNHKFTYRQEAKWRVSILKQMKQAGLNICLLCGLTNITNSCSFRHMTTKRVAVKNTKPGLRFRKLNANWRLVNK